MRPPKRLLIKGGPLPVSKEAHGYSMPARGSVESFDLWGQAFLFFTGTTALRFTVPSGEVSDEVMLTPVGKDGMRTGDRDAPILAQTYDPYGLPPAAAAVVETIAPGFEATPARATVTTNEDGGLEARFMMSETFYEAVRTGKIK